MASTGGVATAVVNMSAMTDMPAEIKAYEQQIHITMYVSWAAHNNSTNCALLMILLLLFSFMQCIYNYIPVTNRVSTVYSVAASL